MVKEFSVNISHFKRKEQPDVYLLVLSLGGAVELQ